MATLRQEVNTDGTDRCTDSCMRCHAACLETLRYCLEQGGEHASVEHTRLLLDCAQICQTSADFMLRGSDLHVETCAVCADICQRCAQSCEQLADDETMRRCAQTCRECAESCRRSAGETHIEHAA
jgi:hypothetical protein